MRNTLERGRDNYSPALLTLLESRLEHCQMSLEKLQKDLAVLDPGLVQTHETLVSILRSTSAVNTRSKVGVVHFLICMLTMMLIIHICC